MAAFDAATVARGAHLDVSVGSVVEPGVATAAGLQLAAALPEVGRHVEREQAQELVPPATGAFATACGAVVVGRLRLPRGQSLGLMVSEGARTLPRGDFEWPLSRSWRGTTTRGALAVGT